MVKAGEQDCVHPTTHTPPFILPLLRCYWMTEKRWSYYCLTAGTLENEGLVCVMGWWDGRRV